MISLTHREWVVATACWLAMGMVALGQGQTGVDPPTAGVAQNVAQNNADAGKSADNGLVIEPAELPVTYPRGPYQVQLQGHGNFVPVLQWKVEGGTLPPGIRLEDNGLLHGSAERAGEFQFVVSAKDGGQPRQAVQRGFVLKVMEAFTLTWKSPAHVAGNRIEGSVEVSNATPEDMDFTFDVKAVAENGRATEIGYQRFPLKHGTIGMALPFGESLPYGTYVIYVNANGEVARRNAIYKERLQTPAPLQVLVGP